MENLKTESGLSDKPDFQQASETVPQPGQFAGDNVRSPLVVEGAYFPHETEFRGKYKGYVYYGMVRNGALALSGKTFFSPCAAAVSITRNPVDGWLFWDCRLPGQSSWVSMDTFKP